MGNSNDDYDDDDDDDQDDQDYIGDYNNHSISRSILMT